ncbi:ATP-binding cassette domain-containing protein [Psychrobium sp. MM17-31]|uniref:ATP-binding cassette domain-containing protein n=1 Tax=Psychrobium sp. MM17-31 TaxID=2917758 RepID=UPI001EF6B18A|nr:ATP-binding cassette domain-containing protein [Psychrobium sp. MM17-31]MCG7532875.1 ATP-binding cassette domain-containing protein [Psychrobium sp. MM17-31]
MTLKLNIQQPLAHFDLDINVELNADGIIGLFGQSGSGKTNLLRAIAGLNESSRGNIVFNSHHWALSSEHACRVGMVFQDSRLFNHLTVAQNIEIVNQLDLAALESLISDFGVAPLLDKRCNLLSAGQQQRVAIVRSLAAKPDLLLLDEPLSALDDTAKQQLMLALKNYSQQQQLVMIYVSHHIDEIHFLCDELMLIEQGNITDSGDCQQLLKRHQLLPHTSQVLDIDESSKQITLQLTDEAFAQLASQSAIKLSK